MSLILDLRVLTVTFLVIAAVGILFGEFLAALWRDLREALR